MKRAAVKKGEAMLIAELECCTRFRERLIGLLGRESLAPGRAIYLAPCQCVHTFFMRFSLDLLFVDADWRVVRVLRNVPPWRIAGCLGGGASGVIELKSGWLASDAVSTGDQLSLVVPAA